MKKTLTIIIIFALGVSRGFANVKNLTDYIDNEKVWKIIKNDTILIQYSSIENNFKFIQPDTIWIKKVKRPKENKHYYLQWFQEPKTYIQNYQENITKSFLFRDFVYYEHNKYALFLYDLQQKREIIFMPNNTINIKCSTAEQEIYSLLKDSLIYYKPLKLSKLNEEFYNSTLLNSCQYKIKINSLYNRNPISIMCNLNFNDNISGYMSDGKIHLNGEVEIITYEEYLSHNKKVQENLRKDSIVRLARVFCDKAICNNQEYAFEGDTMAIIKFFKEEEYPWSDDSLVYVTAYAYGKEYKIKIADSWRKQKEDIVQFIDTMDLDFLKERREVGFQRRKEAAKIWDKKNDSILQNDYVRDTTNAVWAVLDDISYAFLQQIDEYGYRIYESVDKPRSGHRVPIFYYGQAGDLISAWWFIFKGKYYAIDANAYSKIKFENEEDRLYLMRSGRRNFEQRMLRAQIADFSAQFEEY